MSDIGKYEGQDDGDNCQDDHEDPAEESGVGAVAVHRVSVTGAAVKLVLWPQLSLRRDAGPHSSQHGHADEAVLDEAGVEVGTGQAGQGVDDGPVTHQVSLLTSRGAEARHIEAEVSHVDNSRPASVLT